MTLNGYKETGVYENHLAILKDSYKMYDVQGGQLKLLDTPEEINAANVNAKWPLFYNENGMVSTLGIEDGSYLRLNTLTSVTPSLLTQGSPRPLQSARCAFTLPRTTCLLSPSTQDLIRRSAPTTI